MFNFLKKFRSLASPFYYLDLPNQSLWEYLFFYYKALSISLGYSMEKLPVSIHYISYFAKGKKKSISLIHVFGLLA